MEILRRIFRRKAGGEIIAPQPSSFTLVQNDREIRLMVGDTMRLDPGAEKLDPNLRKRETRPVTLFEFRTLATRLEFHIVTNQDGEEHFVNSVGWGQIREDHSGNNQEPTFRLQLTPHALDPREGRQYIRGSDMYFNGEMTSLCGPSWQLQYRP